jgi:hypothetical protein
MTMRHSNGVILSEAKDLNFGLHCKVNGHGDSSRFLVGCVKNDNLRVSTEI